MGYHPKVLEIFEAMRNVDHFDDEVRNHSYEAARLQDESGAELAKWYSLCLRSSLLTLNRKLDEWAAAGSPIEEEDNG